jgi:hypothetical protein
LAISKKYSISMSFPLSHHPLIITSLFHVRKKLLHFHLRDNTTCNIGMCMHFNLDPFWAKIHQIKKQIFAV